MLATKSKIQILQSLHNLRNHISPVPDKYSQQTGSIRRLPYMMKSICKYFTGNIELNGKSMKAPCVILFLGRCEMPSCKATGRRPE